MTLTIVLRLLHIVTGVFWAGVLFFLVLFLAPALKRVGPDAGKLMQEVNKARFFEIMPLVALITIMSGLWLMWILSGGFEGSFFASGWGLTLSIGGGGAIAAFVIGTAVMRPATKRQLELGPRMAAAASEEERQQLGAEMQALRQRSRSASIWAAGLLLIAVAAMAVAQDM